MMTRRRRDMRFVLVNGRTPFRQIFCAQCWDPIGSGYLRDIMTRSYYCDITCYAGHNGGAVALLEYCARAS
jgi:hypothetical protein